MIWHIAYKPFFDYWVCLIALTSCLRICRVFVINAGFVILSGYYYWLIDWLTNWVWPIYDLCRSVKPSVKHSSTDKLIGPPAGQAIASKTTESTMTKSVSLPSQSRSVPHLLSEAGLGSASDNVLNSNAVLPGKPSSLTGTSSSKLDQGKGGSLDTSLENGNSSDPQGHDSKHGTKKKFSLFKRSKAL